MHGFATKGLVDGLLVERYHVVTVESSLGVWSAASTASGVITASVVRDIVVEVLYELKAALELVEQPSPARPRCKAPLCGALPSETSSVQVADFR